MGGSREYDAERGMSFGSWKSKYCVGESQISVWRRFTASGNCDIYGSGGTSDSDVWTLWSLFNIRRGNCIGSDERGSGIWRIYAGCDIKSFWKCRKRISFSTWICKSKTVVSTLDSDRDRGKYSWRNPSPSLSLPRVQQDHGQPLSFPPFPCQPQTGVLSGRRFRYPL